MTSLFADENFHKDVVLELRTLGYDVLTAFDAGLANQRIPDPDMLAYATSVSRAILTFNRKHFIRLHRSVTSHQGIMVCTYDADSVALAQRIQQAIVREEPLDNKLIRINRPVSP
jgi:hypothetical protein